MLNGRIKAEMAQGASPCESDGDKRDEAANSRLFGAIEAGGTKFVCGIGSARLGSLRTAIIPTRSPDATFADVLEFFREGADLGPLSGVGLASFGPVDLNPRSPSHGRVLATPKAGWQDTDLIARARDIADAPVALDTDVNAAALAEARAAGPDISQLAYVTVGTGIGVGIVSGGKTVRGLGHPEGGHIIARRHPAHGDFPGICPFHGDCLEGLASGPAIEAAWGHSPSLMPETHIFWEVQADYLAQLCMTLFLTVAPMRIVLGGGVMKQQQLFPMIHARVADLLGGYFAPVRTADDAARLITPPYCTEPSGLVGAYLLAERDR